MGSGNTKYSVMEESERYQRILGRFQDFMQGRHQFAALTAPAEVPAWLDEEACRRGRQFYLENVYSSNMASLDALLMGMCIQNFYKPLVISRKTVQKSTSRYRYLETGVMLYSWYQDDIWKKDSLANRMINRVNAMHRQVADQVRNIGDLNMDIPQEFYDYINDSKPFSEVDMALIQGSFFAPYLLYPEHYGVAKVPKKDLENFTHLWRTFGYYLGINDAFNAVLDNFEDSKLYCFFVMEKILKPCMLHLDIYGVHMAKTAVFFSDYHVVAYTNYHLVGYDLPNLWASFSLVQRTKYYTKQIYSFFFNLPGVRQALNYFTDRFMKKILSRFNKRNKKQAECPF